MNENVKALIIRFLINLKKYWYIGFVCVISAIIFVCFTSFGVKEQVKTNVNGAMVGNGSITKIIWDFETERNSFLDGAALEAQISVAKTNLEMLLKIGNSAYTANSINVEMQKAGYEALNSGDIYEIKIVGHNLLEVYVYGMNAERVQVIGSLLRAELLRIAEENFGAVSTSDILEPTLFYAQSVATGYELTSQPYEASSDDTSTSEVGQKESIFAMSNILIVGSAVVLWLVIILLLTISDGKLYTEKDIENIGITCYGQISKNAETNRQILSVIHKRAADEKGISLQMLVFGEQHSFPETMLSNGVKNFSYWEEEGVNKIDTKAPVLLAIRVGKCTSDEIEKGLKALRILDTKCIGCILFS